MDHKVKQICELFKQTLTALGITYKRVYLFGSRVRGNYDAGSDYDYLVVTDDVSEENRQKKEAKLLVAMVEHGIDIDVFLCNESEYSKYKNWNSHLIREVDEEGVLC